MVIANGLSYLDIHSWISISNYPNDLKHSDFICLPSQEKNLFHKLCVKALYSIEKNPTPIPYGTSPVSSCEI